MKVVRDQPIGLFRSLLRPVYRWLWRDTARRAHTLLRFAAIEADGGQDLTRAAELTSDPVLRRLYLIHAGDEHRHANLLRDRGAALLRSSPSNVRPNLRADWFSPAEHGLDDLRVDAATDGALLAFLHLSEKSAALDFAAHRAALTDDPPTCAIFDRILGDEVFHMSYTFSQLDRVSPGRRGWLLWRARFGRLWKGYLRLAVGLANVIGTLVLTLQYFVLLPPFALLAKRAERRERLGWVQISSDRSGSLTRQY